MNPPEYSTVPTAPPQWNQYSNKDLPGQADCPRAAHCTTVSMVPEKPPRDHVIWSLCWLLYGNPCCLGLAALIYSVKARDRKVAGDVEGARHYGSTARRLNIVSTVLVSIFSVILIIVVIVVLSMFPLNPFRISRNSYNVNIGEYHRWW